jgi:hypothetical protein
MRRIWTEITTAGAVEAMEAIMMDLEDLMAEEVSTQSSLWVHFSQSRSLLNHFQGLLPITPRPWYNGCDIGSHGTRVERALI